MKQETLKSGSQVATSQSKFWKWATICEEMDLDQIENTISLFFFRPLQTEVVTLYEQPYLHFGLL